MATCDPRYPVATAEVHTSSERRRAGIIHGFENPFPVHSDCRSRDLDDALDHVGRHTQINGHALCGKIRRVAMHLDHSFVFRRQGDPVIMEVTTAGEEGQHCGFAHIWSAIESE